LAKNDKVFDIYLSRTKSVLSQDSLIKFQPEMNGTVGGWVLRLRKEIMNNIFPL